jgi:hypothetical protein
MSLYPRRDHRTLLPVPLSSTEKLILSRLAAASGLSMCGVLRQLLIREHQKPTHRKHLATHRTRVARSDQ